MENGRNILSPFCRRCEPNTDMHTYVQQKKSFGSFIYPITINSKKYLKYTDISHR